MSEISALSMEHQTASAFAQQLNEALIILKKAHLHLSGWEQLDPAAVQEQAVSLNQVLTTIITQLEGGQAPTQAARVPGAVLVQLQALHRGDMLYYLDDLKAVAGQLAQPAPSFQQSDFAKLDELATQADAVATQVFRRLMRL